MIYLIGQMSSFKFLFFGWLFASQKTGFSGFRYRFIPSLRFGTGYASPYNPCHCLKLKNSKLNLLLHRRNLLCTERPCKRRRTCCNGRNPSSSWTLWQHTFQGNHQQGLWHHKPDASKSNSGSDFAFKQCSVYLWPASVNRIWGFYKNLWSN